ncbi:MULTISPECIES: DsbA family oxidoreductase [unclassified Pseudoalteromonas]|uniref:DsbA family oxidoreductase n=1 Tax=unclassified Pseudoalteromonas TaxID=194690 RepID=UPI00257250FA|nr:DsbA family oxidoreductase [Pseudoalteromonas sp. MM1]BED91221.1 2-hydroxychromene-2-carboxylate isomerase [Pseudoalteromonas sp. MM1]
MNKQIKIDFVSDAVCPWCAIGYTRLKQAIAELNLQEEVHIEWQPFFLNPEMPLEGENIYDYGTRKYGRTKQEGDFNRANITQLGNEAGFTFNFTDNSRVVNTRDAHTLLDFLKGTKEQTELKEKLFNAFFTEQKDISDRKVLEHLLRDTGVKVPNISKILDDQDTQNRIANKVSHWHSLGITVVPTMIFNNELVVNGSRTIEAYKQILTELVSSYSLTA